MKLTVFERTTQAQRWVAAGYKSLDDLLNKAKLSYGQRIGVEHYNVSHTVVFPFGNWSNRFRTSTHAFPVKRSRDMVMW